MLEQFGYCATQTKLNNPFWTCGMKGKFVLVSGTASRSCSPERLDRAFEFVERLTAEILRVGGGFVVLLGDENQAKGADGKPRIFDWVIMRSIKSYAENTINPHRVCARVVLSDDAWERKMDDRNRGTFNYLQQHGVLSIEYIRRELYTGGEYRRSECELADGLVTLGGGKGTYTVGNDMLDLGKPVLPLDLEIGALSEDGEGALQLHRELLVDPKSYFPQTHRDVMNRIETLSLNQSDHDVASVALRAVEVLSRELGENASELRHDAKPFYGKVGEGINKFLTLVGIMRGVEFLRNLFSAG